MAVFKKNIIKWGLLSVLVILITAGFVGYKMYTKPHRNVERAKAIAISAIQLATEYETNEPVANSKYLDKILQVNGEINEISKNQKGETVIVLKGTDMGTIRCTLEGVVAPEIKTGSSTVVKGICTGYLTDVVIVRCIFQNK